MACCALDRADGAIVSREMSYGAPWERGVGKADTTTLCDTEVPGLVPAVGEVGLGTKQARRDRSQREKRRRRRAEGSSRRARWVVDRDRCIDVIAGVVDGHCQELRVLSRGFDLCETTLCSDVAEVRTWVTTVVEELRGDMLRVVDTMAGLARSMDALQRACKAAGEVVDGVGAASGEHCGQVPDDAVPMEGVMDDAGGIYVAGAESPSVQAQACEGRCGSAAGAVGGTPDLPRLSTAPCPLCCGV